MRGNCINHSKQTESNLRIEKNSTTNVKDQMSEQEKALMTTVKNESDMYNLPAN